MLKKRFTDGQISFALRHAGAGSSLNEVCQQMGVAGRRITSMDGSPVEG